MTTERDVETTVCEIRRNTCKKYFEDEKIRIVLECLRGGTGAPELRRRKRNSYEHALHMIQGIPRYERTFYSPDDTKI